MRVFSKLSFHILILLFAFYVNKEVQASVVNSKDYKNTEHVTDQSNKLIQVQDDDDGKIDEEDEFLDSDGSSNSEETTDEVEDLEIGTSQQSKNVEITVGNGEDEIGTSQQSKNVEITVGNDKDNDGKPLNSVGSSNLDAKTVKVEALEEEIVFFTSLFEPKYIVESDSISKIYFEQKVDHFNTEDKRTFTQRAYVDRFHEKPDGPVVLNVVSFKSIHTEYMEDPTIQFLGQRLHATIYILEHRYYGKSVPTNVSTENLEKYNNTEQALADIKNFILSSDDKDKPWIVYGTGYGGTLAGWFRLKYPDVASAALVSAAPFRAMTEIEYKYNVLKRIPVDIKTIFQSAFDQLKKFIQESRFDVLQKKFKMCTKLNEGNLNDNVKFMYWTIIYDIAAIVDNYNLRDIIKDIRNDVQKDVQNELDLLAYVITSYYKQDCVSVDFNDAIMKYKNINIIYEEQIDYPMSLVLGLGTRPFLHQRCKEYGFFDTFGDGSHSFGITIDIVFYTKLCNHVFDIEGFDTSRFNELINTTNTKYGGRDIQTTNIISIVPNIQFWEDIGMAESENNILIKIDYEAEDKSFMKEEYYMIIDTLEEWTINAKFRRG